MSIIGVVRKAICHIDGHRMSPQVRMVRGVRYESVYDPYYFGGSRHTKAIPQISYDRQCERCGLVETLFKEPSA